MRKLLNFIHAASQNPWIIVEYGLLLVFYPFNLIILVIWGVNFRMPILFFGMPLIMRTRGSTILFGKNFETKNGSWANLVGINHPCCIATYTKDARIIIGDNCGVSGGSIVARLEIILGNNVLIGANCMIVDNDFHSIKTSNRRFRTTDIETRPVRIGNNVFIGANSIVLKGSKIGNNSVIGAGSVVAGSIPANCIAAGNPAKVLRSLK